MNKTVFKKGEYLIYGFEKDGCHIIPPHYQPKKFSGDTALWLLPADKTGKDAEHNWHGASFYYEYPNVWMYVFICKYLGIRHGFDCDYVLEPLFLNGTVRLPQYGIEITVNDGRISEIKNLGGRPVTVRLAAENRVINI